VVCLFGVTEAGNSIAVNVKGYHPYFFALAPQGFGTEHIDRGIELLNNAFKVVPFSNKRTKMFF
jgi:hypothetical protein